MKFILSFFLIVASLTTYSQQTTTFILVRHAEKADDGTRDPALSEAGNARAQNLLKALNKTSINAIYSTNYKRTRQTVTPLATEKKLEILTYDGLKMEQIDQMLTDHAGGTILVVGHSNTVPAVANYLSGQTYKNFDDSEYGNLIIVTLTEKGKGKVTWLTY